MLDFLKNNYVLELMFIAMLIYLTFSFVHLSFSFEHWSIVSRVIASISLFIIIIASMFVASLKRYKQGGRR
jgi:uncharacterized membrane protein